MYAILTPIVLKQNSHTHKNSFTQYASFISDTCKQISEDLFESISNMQVNSKVRIFNLNLSLRLKIEKWNVIP